MFDTTSINLRSEEHDRRVGQINTDEWKRSRLDAPNSTRRTRPIDRILTRAGQVMTFALHSGRKPESPHSSSSIRTVGSDRPATQS